MIIKKFLFKTKIFWIILIILIILGGLSFQFTRSSDQSKVRIGYLPIIGSHLLYIAQNQSYFKSESVFIELYKFQSSNQLMEAMLRDDIDLCVEMSAVPLLKVSEEDPGDFKIFLISKIFLEDEFDGIIILQNSNISQLKDLEGKSIATFPGSTAPALLEHFLIEKGVDTSDISFKPMPPQNHLTALSQHFVDAVHSYEPTTSQGVLSNLSKKLYGSVYSEQINPSPQGVAIISTKFMEEKPFLANKVINIFKKSSEFLIINNTLSKQILQNELGLDESVINNIKVYERAMDGEVISSFNKYMELLNNLNETSFDKENMDKVLIN
jgi:ABC-type nitrate/sulfonate/bicarbonate transport system substrate-binding protein